MFGNVNKLFKIYYNIEMKLLIIKDFKKRWLFFFFVLVYNIYNNNICCMFFFFLRILFLCIMCIDICKCILIYEINL